MLNPVHVSDSMWCLRWVVTWRHLSFKSFASTQWVHGSCSGLGGARDYFLGWCEAAVSLAPFPVSSPLSVPDPLLPMPLPLIAHLVPPLAATRSSSQPNSGSDFLPSLSPIPPFWPTSSLLLLQCNCKSLGPTFCTFSGGRRSWSLRSKRQGYLPPPRNQLSLPLLGP